MESRHKLSTSRPRPKGSSQNTRRLPALEPSFAPVDDRTEANFLVWAARFSKVVAFFNRHNRIEGDWAPFFESEPIVQYAIIDSQEMDNLAAALLEQLHAWQKPFSPATGGLAEGNLLSHLYEQCQRINRWHRFFSQRLEEKIFAGEIAAAIDLTFANALETAQRWEERAVVSDSLGTFELEKDLSSFDRVIWKLGLTADRGAPDEPHWKREAAQILWAAQGAETRLVTAARARLKELLAEPRQLAPHFALYLAFLRQMTHAQNQLNALTGEHLDLFHRTVLEEKPAPVKPDRVYVAFGADAAKDPFQLAAGTVLAAKDPAGQPILYQLTEPVDLSGYSIGQMATIYLHPPALRAPGSGFYAATSDGLAGEPWPMFGREPDTINPGSTATPAATDACIGFAVASPCLHLEGGNRAMIVKILFEFQLANGTKPPMTGKATSLANAGVSYAYSSATQWASPAAGPGSGEFSVTLENQGANQILATLVVALDPGDPPCVSFDPTKLTGAFDPGAAVLKILLRNPIPGSVDSVTGSFIWLLSSATVEKIELEVQVCAAPPQRLANEGSDIVPGVAILPFRDAPHPGSSFYIGCAELLPKQIKSLTLNLDWQNLPLDRALYPNGLPSYYSDYAETITQACAASAIDPPSDLFSRCAYYVRLDCLVGGIWRPWPMTIPCPLFPDPTHVTLMGRELAVRGSAYGLQPSDESIPSRTKFTVNAWPIPIPPASPPAAQTKAPLPSAEGCLRVQLTAPSYAFGHAIYPQVLNDAAMRNAKALMTKAQQDLASADQIFDRWKVSVGPKKFQLPSQLFLLLPSAKPDVPVFPGGVAPQAVVAALLKLEKQGDFPDRSTLDWRITRNLGLTIAPPSDLLLAIYRWIDRLLSGSSATTLQSQPNPPLTPALAAVTLDYRATAVISLSASDEPACCYQILPFSTRRLPTPGVPVTTLLERFAPGGYLYVGLAQVVPNQTISLLFVLQEQPAVGPEKPALAALEWRVLCRTGWTPVTPELHTLNDGSFGLQKSGLVKVAIPSEMDTQSSLMPSGFCWLQVHAPQPSPPQPSPPLSERYPAILQILPQAGVAAWVPGAAEPASAALHFRQPLATGALKGLQRPDPRVKTILQPLPSFGGRPAETEQDLRVRVSERLRHKGRAWTAWDYERLLLQQFPEIFYARCLPHTRYSADTSPETPAAPGHVLVIVLPFLSQRPTALPPGFAAGELVEMEKWLRARTSPVVQLSVSNPTYETLKLSIQAAFSPAQPPGAAKRQLNEELQDFISPWIYRPNTVLLPPFEFHLSAIRDFIKARPYVQSLVNCQVIETQELAADGWIRPSRSWSLLVTAENHSIAPPP